MLGAEYRVLGPLEVLYNGEPVTVPAGKGRVLLATLLLRPNQFVSVDELVERLWDGSPPSLDRVTKTLHMTVTRLRQALGPANCVSTTTNGYLADVENLDLLRFRALAGKDPHAALALWRGPALTNVVSDALHLEDVPRLADERLVVVEERIEHDLDGGMAAELVPELRALTAAHPLRERFWAQLMVALYRADQQAAALEAFREVSELLADELGIDPGGLLRGLHQSILRAEPALSTPGQDTAVPRQLPADLARFTGRTDDLARLDRLLPTGTAGQAVVISAIAGSAGVGKTALAVRWAHRVRDRFPDGQLAVNLRGYDREEPVTPHDALGQLLRGLGLGSKEIPDETEQRIGAYRSLLADRRVLVLLDNARAAEQVRPLLPAGGRSVVVITSRSDLRGLVALNDAKVLKLGVLPLDEAVQLLEKVIGADRAGAETEAVTELARLCACLPLALRIAASMLAGEPHLGVRDLVDQLRTGDRLAELEIGGDQEAAVRAAFDLSYTALAPEERRMFRVLGLSPRADFTPMSAGALLGVPSPQALKLLRTLARAHLVEEHAPQRFAQHDLLRLHARERAAAEETADLRRDAVVRFLDHHLHSVDNAERAIRPNRHEKTLTEREAVVETVELGDRLVALTWCRQEHDLLIELCEFALAEEHLEHAWKLPYSMLGYLQILGSTDEYLRIYTIALSAARRLRDRHAEAVALHTLGVAHKNMRHYEDALRVLLQALRIRREIGDDRGVAVTEAELASTYLWQGRRDEALRHYRESVEQWQIVGNDTGRATSMNSLARSLIGRGDHAGAITVANAALAALDPGSSAMPAARDTLAQAYAGLGDLDEAVRVYRDLFSAERPAYPSSGTKAEILFHGAEILERAGHRHEALTHAREALVLAERGRSALTDKIRVLVRELGN
ncbi:BTAD domain-containing putative transcriptional regulator [Lentzea sp. NPDC051213]|uniref:AfsR/SARP family transcriptional regulator n=1 Tax=Lentzea sp. NPDC051213 TaxID=3364126 RepID=UPI0037AA485E